MSNIETLKEHNFKFNKAYGQNFIFDTNFLQSIVDKIDVENKTILEIEEQIKDLPSSHEQSLDELNHIFLSILK